MPFLEELKRELIESRVEAIRERIRAKTLEARVIELEEEVIRLKGTPSHPNQLPQSDLLESSATANDASNSQKRPLPVDVDTNPSKQKKKRDSGKVPSASLSLFCCFSSIFSSPSFRVSNIYRLRLALPK